MFGIVSNYSPLNLIHLTLFNPLNTYYHLTLFNAIMTFNFI
nr:MAG TPA: hypothetical protein [Caudoviricetes sp.]